MRAFFVIASALLLAGCFSSFVAEDEIACVSKTNCPAGMVCDTLRGHCIPGEAVAGCRRHQECPFGTLCEDGECVEGCIETGDCGLDRDCIDGRCAAAGSCTTDAVCPFGQLCDKGTKRCFEPAAVSALCDACGDRRWCLTGTDCPTGRPCDRPDPNLYGSCRTCPTGECRYDGAGTNCTNNSQCSNGDTCQRYPCGTDDFCQQFNLGTCGPAVLSGAPRAAEGVGTCTVGTCLSPICTTTDCAAPDDPSSTAPKCPRGYECFTIISLPDDTCTNNNQCPSRRCERLNEADATRFCTCTGNADCPADTTCTPEGYCLIGSQCLPALGLSCEDVHP